MITKRRLTDPWFIPMGNQFAAAYGLNGSASLTGTGNLSANHLYLLAVLFPSNVTVTALSLLCSATSSGNYSLGLWDENNQALARQASTALTVGVNTYTFANPLRVREGRRYKAGFTVSTAAAQIANFNAANTVTSLAEGVMDVTSAVNPGSLPDPVVPTETSATNLYMPILAFSVAGLPT